jgi:cytochrome c-type biogenesis protein CcmH/NrfG
VRRPTVARYIAMSILYGLGLLAKPMLVTVPFVLLLLDYWPLQRLTLDRKSIARVAGEKIPLFVLAAMSCVITFIAQSRTMHHIRDLPFPTRLSNAFLSCLIYVWQMFWPVHLAPFYPYNWYGGLAVIAAILFMIGVSANVLALHRRFPYLVTGWFWYVVVLVPVIGLVQVGLQGHADRYTYLPHIGLYLALTWLVADFSKTWRHRATMFGIGALIVLGLLSWSAHEQTQYWRDSGTLWRHALTVTYNNYAAHNNLAAVLQSDEEANSHLQEALRLQPDYADAHYNLARILARKGEIDNAIEHLQKTAAIEPDNADAWSKLGDAFLAKGRTREATRYYERALQLAPESLVSLNGLAWILATCPDTSLRDGARAVQLSTKAVEVSRRQDPLALRSLSAAYAETGRFDKATATGREALQLALAQSNSDLAAKLELELDLYQINLPLRDHSLKTSPPSL